MRQWTCFFWLMIFLAGFLLPGGCVPQKAAEQGEKLTIAAAANMQFAIEEIVKSFTQESGIPCELVISSSGKLTAQISEGAPYDVFLSADMRYPETLFNSGHAIASPRVYARGQLVLWLADSTVTSLDSPDISHIAIANPGTAPYGVAAEAYLRRTGLYARLAKKLVYGESISQVNHFMHSGAADAGFTALSALLASDLSQQGSWSWLDTAAYPPIRQGVVILNNKDLRQASRAVAPAQHEARQQAAQQFYEFLFSAKCKAILEEYGFLIDNQVH